MVDNSGEERTLLVKAVLGDDLFLYKQLDDVK